MQCVRGVLVGKFDTIGGAKGVPGIHGTVLRWHVAADLESVVVSFISHGK